MLSAAAFWIALVVHDEKLSVSRIEVGGAETAWSLVLPLEGLAKVLKLPAEPLDFEDEDLPLLAPELGSYLARAVTLECGGRALPFRMGALKGLREIHLATGRPYVAHVEARLVFATPQAPERIKLSAALFATVTEAHKALLDVRWGEKSRRWRRTGPFELELRREDVDPTLAGTVSLFVLWGMEHIFIGADHLAFLLALLLAASKLGDMVRIVTSFTVAHSLTLFLASMDVIRLAPALTEALIAASIVYVAAENLWLKEAGHRWILTFIFGLVHGLGFSGVLKERLEGLDGILLPVLSFNLGVEVGQLAVLLVLFPLLARLRRGADAEASQRRQLRLLRGGSVPILLLGLGWLGDRVFQWGLMPI